MKGVYGLMVNYRDHKCLCCGHVQKIQTNHTGGCYAWCEGCSWKSTMIDGSFVAAGTNRPFEFTGTITKEKDYNPNSGIEWGGN